MRAEQIQANIKQIDSNNDGTGDEESREKRRNNFEAESGFSPLLLKPAVEKKNHST